MARSDEQVSQCVSLRYGAFGKNFPRSSVKLTHVGRLVPSHPNSIHAVNRSLHVLSVGETPLTHDAVFFGLATTAAGAAPCVEGHR